MSDVQGAMDDAAAVPEMCNKEKHKQYLLEMHCETSVDSWQCIMQKAARTPHAYKEPGVIRDNT